MGKYALLLVLLLIVGGAVAYVITNGEPSGTPTPSPTASVSVSPSQSVSPSTSVSTSPRVSSSPLKTPTPAAQTHTIRITSSGYSTKNLTIKVGDTVTFVNDDTTRHWPASGPHPQHTTCPGFDPLKGLNQGETYSFKFTTAKTCPFHDHLAATNNAYYGSIIVQ